jgi:predicted GH43/DUF377 family glycosyl hydrolase
MRWEKKGLVYKPAGDRWWSRGYAHLPTAHRLGDDVLRVYFASLDENKYGRIGYVDLDAADPRRILRVTPEPVLDLGERGTFEDCGVVPSCLVERDGELLCFYHGFQRTERVPYMIFTGLASVDPATGALRRRARTPVLDRTSAEPFLRGAPAVLYEDGRFRAWYVSCLRWMETGSHLHYHNVIRHAVSPDGFRWEVDDHVCLEPRVPDEYSVGRPAVVHDDSGYRMWFSVRSHTERYTISYAHSTDGLHWTRDDAAAGITRGAEGWDAQIICYPYVLRVGQQWYMFYNGNGHGASGFGLAVAAEGSLN